MAIQIVRQTSVDRVYEMMEHFALDEQEQRELLVAQIRQALTFKPESVLVIQALREDEVIGFIICDLALGQPYIWLSQAWSHPRNTYRVADEMWKRVQQWMVALGKYEVRAETKRQLNVLQRRFGFEPVSTTIACDIRKELNVKPVQQTEEQKPERVKPGATGTVGSTGGVLETTDRRTDAGAG